MASRHMEDRMRSTWRLAAVSLSVLCLAVAGEAATFTFTTGAPDFKIATASHPAGTSVEVETADDFTTAGCTTITSASFYGLLPPATSITSVGVELYRIFPLDSTNPPSGHVPSRFNSPADSAFDTRDSLAGQLTFTAALINPSGTTLNSVVTGIHPVPNQTTGGDGPVSGEEVRIDVTFTTPFVLPAGQYFIVPQVALSSGTFLWLSAPKTIPSPADLQTWIRDTNLAPDWLRIGTDIVDSGSQFDAAFSLSGTTSTIGVNANNASPLTAQLGSATSTTFSGSGGVGPYTFTETGALPTGVTLTSAGVLSGTPQTIGSFPITVTATDSGGCSGTLDFTLNVIAPIPALDVRLLALLAAMLSAIAFRALVR
jgi:hypothetical protein